MKLKNFLVVAVLISLAGCNKQPEIDLVAKVDSVIKEQSIGPDEHYLAIAWVETGTAALEKLQLETAALISPTFTPKPDRTQFSPGAYKSADDEVATGGGACIFVWKGRSQTWMILYPI